MSDYSNADQFFFMVGTEKRAALRIYRRYKVNRSELNILAALSCYLQLHGKRIIGRGAFLDWLGLSYQLRRKAEQYIYGLTIKGLVKRLAYRKSKGLSFSLSRYGVHILECFYNEVEAIDQATRERKDKPGFQSLIFDNETLPKGYRLLDPGRDN